MPRSDGFIKLKVDSNCGLIIDGFLGGYCRDEDTDEPVKDGYYEHIFDALRYLVCIIYNQKTYEVIRPSYPWTKKRKTANATTGY